jgi:hypothetical protein
MSREDWSVSNASIFNVVDYHIEKPIENITTKSKIQIFAIKVENQIFIEKFFYVLTDKSTNIWCQTL